MPRVAANKTSVKKFVQVGYANLSADVVKVRESIKYGEVVEVSDPRALEYCENATYEDGARNIRNAFVPFDSSEGQAAIKAAAQGLRAKPRRRLANKAA